MSLVWKGYVKANKKGERFLKKFYKKHPEMKDFVKEATDMFDQILAYGEDGDLN